MADIDDSVAAVCPIIKLVQNEPKSTMKIYRVSWKVHNYVNGQYTTTKRERLFETIDGARRFNETRQAAADLIGLIESPSTGSPWPLEVEGE